MAFISKLRVRRSPQLPRAAALRVASSRGTRLRLQAQCLEEGRLDGAGATEGHVSAHHAGVAVGVDLRLVGLHHHLVLVRKCHGEHLWREKERQDVVQQDASTSPARQGRSGQLAVVPLLHLSHLLPPSPYHAARTRASPAAGHTDAALLPRKGTATTTVPIKPPPKSRATPDLRPRTPQCSTTSWLLHPPPQHGTTCQSSPSFALWTHAQGPTRPRVPGARCRCKSRQANPQPQALRPKRPADDMRDKLDYPFTPERSSSGPRRTGAPARQVRAPP